MVKENFASAHQLRGYAGKCEALHGHNWRVQLYVTAEKINDIGLAIDFKELKKCLHTILETLDHTNLNELAPFQTTNPSSENIARYIFQRATKGLKEKKVQVDSIRVWESENAYTEYYH